MSRDYEGNYFLAGSLVATVFWVLAFCALIIPDCMRDSHKELGSKDRVCFANHTCRENLKCVYTEGLEPWSGVCVQK